MTFDSNSTFIANRLRQLENDVSNLAWRSFNTSIVFDDILIDNFSSVDGINETFSSYLYDAVNTRIYKPVGSDLALVTDYWNSLLSSPNSVFCLIEVVLPEDTVAINTDIKAYISTDNGENYTQFTSLFQLFLVQSTRVAYLKGEINSLTSSTNQIVLKIQTKERQKTQES